VKRALWALRALWGRSRIALRVAEDG